MAAAAVHERSLGRPCRHRNWPGRAGASTPSAGWSGRSVACRRGCGRDRRTARASPWWRRSRCRSTRRSAPSGAPGGRIVDGVLPNRCSPERVRSASPRSCERRRTAGRDPADRHGSLSTSGRAWASERPGTPCGALQAAAGEHASYPVVTRVSSRSWGSMRERRQAAARARVGPARGCAGRPGPAVARVGEPSAAEERLAGLPGRPGADLPVVYPVSTPSDPIGSVAGDADPRRVPVDGSRPRRWTRTGCTPALIPYTRLVRSARPTPWKRGECRRLHHRRARYRRAGPRVRR